MKNMTPNEVWLLILQFLAELPPWVKVLSQSDPAALFDSKTLNIEYKMLDASYIEFLDQQIVLEPRGPEWNEILKKRATALRPLIGKPIITALLLSENHSLTIKIDPDQKRILTLEET